MQEWICIYKYNLSSCVQGAGAGSQTQDPCGHRAGIQAEVPTEIWQEGDQQEIPAVC